MGGLECVLPSGRCLAIQGVANFLIRGIVMVMKSRRYRFDLL